MVTQTQSCMVLHMLTMLSSLVRRRAGICGFCPCLNLVEVYMCFTKYASVTASRNNWIRLYIPFSVVLVFPSIYGWLKSPITITWDGPLLCDSASSLWNLSSFAGELVELLYVHTSMTLIYSLKFNWIHMLSLKTNSVYFNFMSSQCEVFSIIHCYTSGYFFLFYVYIQVIPI